MVYDRWVSSAYYVAATTLYIIMEKFSAVHIFSDFQGEVGSDGSAVSVAMQTMVPT